MTLNANYGTAKSKVGQGMGLHAQLDHPEWVQQFKFYTDEGLIGPAPRADNPLCAGLCIGIDPDADTPAFIMVERTDARRRVTFGGTLMEQAAAYAEKVAAAFPATLPGSDSIVLIVKHPPMPWLGSGQKAVIMSGGVRELEGGKAFANLGIGSALDAVEFVADGEPEKMRLRLQCKKMATLDYSHGPGKTAPGQDVNCYGDPEHPDWCPSSRFGDDGTIGPLIHGNNPMAAQCCLGYHRGANGVTSIKMVKRDDPKRLIFGSAHDMEGFIADLVAQRAAVAAAVEQLKTDAIAACNDERKAQLKHDGFTKFEGGIPRHLVLNAMREINREIGLSSTTTDQFKAKTFAAHPDIAKLIKQSMAPHICAALMGGTPDYYRNQIGGGQLALRFPGDMCDDGKATCSAERFAGVAKGWHIDGCANEFIPGTTDHYGTVHNFSMLIGCLLSDVPEKMSGELCCYPGSHTALAEYFSQGKNLKTLKQKGNKVLPTDKTQQLFTRPIFHGTGTAGTLFVANYLTAHFIAPNTAPFIRYAVYFRVSSPRHRAGQDKQGMRSASMLDPWCDWEGLSEVAEGSNEGAVVVPPAPYLTREELLEAQRVQLHMATADYKEVYSGSGRGGGGGGGGGGPRRGRQGESKA
jgi:hypothetical protein